MNFRINILAKKKNKIEELEQTKAVFLFCQGEKTFSHKLSVYLTCINMPTDVMYVNEVNIDL